MLVALGLGESSGAGDSTYRKSHGGTVTITRVKPTPTPGESPNPDRVAGPTS